MVHQVHSLSSDTDSRGYIFAAQFLARLYQIWAQLIENTLSSGFGYRKNIVPYQFIYMNMYSLKYNFK